MRKLLAVLTFVLAILVLPGVAGAQVETSPLRSLATIESQPPKATSDRPTVGVDRPTVGAADRPEEPKKDKGDSLLLQVAGLILIVAASIAYIRVRRSGRSD